jgi:hypothetical protein
LERVMGIEPTSPAWKAGALPLSYTRGAKPKPCRQSLKSAPVAGEVMVEGVGFEPT